VTVEVRIAALEAVVDQLSAKLTAANERIGELEELLEASRRAGKRQAAPFAKGAPTKDPKRSGRKTGKDHGRHNHRQAPTHIDIEHDAEVSERCGCGGTVTVDGEQFQYSLDLPTVGPHVTRFRIQIGHCQTCGQRHQGRHNLQTSDALGAAASQVGPRAKAWATWLHYGLGLSFAKCSQVLEQLGVTVTASALVQAAASTGNDLETIYNDLVGDINKSAMVVMDETGWHVGGLNNWLWVATSPDTTVYNIAKGRSFKQAKQLLSAEFAGVLVRDGWHSYRAYKTAEHQTCFAHLLRRCHDLTTDLPPADRITPIALRAVLEQALNARDQPIEQRRQLAKHLAERVAHLCEQPQRHPANTRLLKHIKREHHALFTFLTHHNVDATNWRAEQAIRPAVVNRKVWGGNRTPTGATTQARIMSTLRTANQRGIHTLDYLTNNARAPTPLPLTR